MAGLSDEEALHEMGRSIRITDGWIAIAGVSVRELADEFGTPCYVYSAEALDSRILTLNQSFPAPVFRLLYSIKANPSIEIIQRCLGGGLAVDACSPRDVEIAMQAGATADHISYTGVGLTEDDIVTLARQQVHVNLDSYQEALRWARVAPGTDVGIRCNPGIEAGFHRHCQAGTVGGKFGISGQFLPMAISALESAKCQIRTLHAHIGSSIASAVHHLAELDYLLALARDLPSVESVNLGGGIAARYHPYDVEYPLSELREGCVDRISRFEQTNGRQLRIEIEPGEFVVSESGWILCKVLVTKNSIAIVDASTNHLPSPMLYGSYVHIYVDGKEKGVLERSACDVYGNTNQAGDRFALGRLLPEIESGDLLLVRNAGAYAFSRVSHFNERPEPAGVWVESGNAKLIRPARIFV